MIVSLVEHVVEMLNMFPSKESISDTMSPATIVEGKPKVDFDQKRLPYGAYAQVWIGTKNNMTERAVPGIALRASNTKGGFYFMSLYTGKRINSYVWNELPISDKIVERIREMAKEQKQSKLTNGAPIFEWDSVNNNRNETDNVEEENVEEEKDEEDELCENDNNQITDDEDLQMTEEESSCNNNESTIINEMQEFEDEEQTSVADDVQLEIENENEMEIALGDFNVPTTQNDNNT